MKIFCIKIREQESRRGPAWGFIAVRRGEEMGKGMGG
jgi:hypothetical protein